MLLEITSLNSGTVLYHRILRPSVLREFAGLEKDVVLVGVASRIEIWSKDRWTESISTYDDDMDEVAANMESLGFSI